MNVDWADTPCTTLQTRPLSDGTAKKDGWNDIGSDQSPGGWWTADYAQIRDGGTGRLSCGGDCNTNTAMNGGGQWRKNPHGFSIPDVRIFGQDAHGAPGCAKSCPFLASKNVFAFGPNDDQVYTIDFDAKVYGECDNVWYAVWLDPICYNNKCPGLGARQTEIDMVENLGGTTVNMNYDTCMIGQDTCYKGGEPPLEGLPATGVGAGSCEQKPYMDSTICDVSGGCDWKAKKMAPVLSSLLDHHVSIQWEPRGPTYNPPNGKVQVSVCNKKAEAFNNGHCSCLPDHAFSTIGPAGWADNWYKFVVDIWGANLDGNGKGTCSVEVSNLQILNQAGKEVTGSSFQPNAQDYGVCSQFYNKYSRTLGAANFTFAV
jgi:hypothetical protein